MAEEVGSVGQYGTTDAMREALDISNQIRKNYESIAKSSSKISTGLSGGGAGGGSTMGTAAQPIGGGLGWAGVAMKGINLLMSGGKSDGSGSGWGQYGPGAVKDSSGKPLEAVGGENLSWLPKNFGGEAAQWADSLVGSAFNDLTLSKDTALEYERARLIARGGTGNFNRFQQNFNTAMNKYNVQDRSAMLRDLATAYNQNYSIMFGGGEYGETKAAETVGGLHTLASAAGLQGEAVGSAMEALYSSQSYYKAMASGIQTRDARSGNMLDIKDIVNQYQKRFAGASSDQIRRAMGPGGMLRAELMQTWGDEGLVDIISEGLLMTAQTGGPIEGGIEEIAKKAGYFGTDWTQGKDSTTNVNEKFAERVAEYTNDFTQGMEIANNALATFHQLLTNLPQPLRAVISGMETLAGHWDALDEKETGMPSVFKDVVGKLKELIGWTGTIALGVAGSLGFDAMNVATDAFRHGVLGEDRGGGDPTSVGYAGGAWGNTNTPGGQDQTPPTSEELLKSGNGPALYPIGGGILGEGYEVEGVDSSANAVVPDVRPGSEEATSTADKVPQTVPGGAKGGGTNVIINLTIQNASDQQAMAFAGRVKRIIENDQKMYSIGMGKMA